MSDLWDVLEGIDALTGILTDARISAERAGLSREERMAATEKLREAYLRMGHILEEWRDTQTS